MAVISCFVNLDDPTLNIAQESPIIQFNHNISQLSFTRYLSEYTEGVSVVPDISLIFQTPRKETFTFKPVGYSVVERTRTDSGDEEEPTATETGEETGGETEPTAPSTSEDEPPVEITYWEETYTFNIPRILTEWPGELIVSLCYIWRDKIVDEDGEVRDIIAQEWNSLPASLTVNQTLHTYEVINQIDPSYVLEYDDTGTIAYLTPDRA